jgi:predicted DCC family thiol-disulfide oxidoreductase YuxK
MPYECPTLVFDGACGICRAWVDYWGALTGASVRYRPYQQAAADFPQIAPDDFKRAMMLIEPDGRVTAGAAAAFRLFTYAPSRGYWWRLYESVPGFAPVSEAAYTFLSQRRGLLTGITRALWGVPIEPERHNIVSWLFLRGFGLIYVAAFYSLTVQILGLVGSAGMLPLSEYLDAAHAGWGTNAYWQLPTLFWLSQNDTLLVAGAWLGAGLGLLVTLGVLVRPALIAAFVLYLSYVYAGQLFMSFQWDMLLIECGFLAIFLTGGSRIVVWLYRLLLFRFLFLAGLVKILSGDATWQQFTALDFHFWTQPLPSPLAWYAAQLPDWVLTPSVVAVLALELGLAFAVFLPRRPRMLLALVTVAFQLAIMATGNYNWFNLLTILVCLFLLDDAAVRRHLPCTLVARIYQRAPRPRRIATWTAAAVALVTVPVGLNYVWEPLAGRNLPIAGKMAEAIAPLLIVNPYGVFATTTTTRPEIVIEGSDDGRTWRAYVLPYMPGPVERAPRWNIPYQPRLDWQMWFASYGSAAQHRWIERLLLRLLQGSKPVLGLFAGNPFNDHPPKYVRAQLYDYRFSDPRLSNTNSAWWVRRPAGVYFPRVERANFRTAPSPPDARPAIPGPGAIPGTR